MVPQSFSFPAFLDARGDVEQLALTLEHLEQAAALLESEGLVQHRLALVATDHLGEVLLQRNVDHHVFVSEELGRLTQTSYSQAERRRLAADFGARVRLASAPADDPMSSFFPAPLLDDTTAIVFRVGHGYRNALYHGDRHNSAVLRPLAILYLRAVGEAIVRSYREGHARGGDRTPAVEPLRRLGWKPTRGSTLTGAHIPYRDAAKQIVSRLLQNLKVEPTQLAHRLVEDISDRSSAVIDELDALQRDGVRPNQQRTMLRSALTWAAHRADDELIRLRDEQHQLIRAHAADSTPVSDDEREALNANELAQFQRISDLDRELKPPITLNTARSLQRRATQLTASKGMAPLLRRYQQLDAQLHLLEQAVQWMVWQWDDYVQDELDRQRGK